jgi:ribosome maturation factor RimP
VKSKSRKSADIDNTNDICSVGEKVAIRKDDIISMVEALTIPLCESEAMELVHIEYQSERGGKILRVYIDKEGGVTLDDCVLISRQLGDLLDVNLEGAGKYNLEVSSPGPDRPLGKFQDFDRFKHCMAKLRVKKPIEGRKNFTGILQGVVDEYVRIQIAEKAVNIPYQNISRARLVNYNGDIPC